MRAINWLGALGVYLQQRHVRRAGLRSARRWRGGPSVAAEIDLLESRAFLNASITSFYLANDTGTPDDDVTSDASVAGTVSYDSSSYVVVELDLEGDGVPDYQADVNADGSFYFDANGLVPYGQVTIRARTQTWNDMYEVVYGDWVSLTFTYNMPPQITSFTAIEGPDSVWTFEGTVWDENVMGLTIVFGGVLDGHQVLANGDGTFSYSLQLTPDQEGLVTAQTTDEYGEDSNIAEDWIIRA